MNGQNQEIVLNLRERRTELAEQIERLEATRIRVESDLDAIDRVMEMLSGQRPAAPSLKPVRRQPRRPHTGGLSHAIRQALHDFGALTTDDLIAALTVDGASKWSESSICSSVSAMKSKGKIIANRGSGRAYVWSLAASEAAA